MEVYVKTVCIVSVSNFNIVFNRALKYLIPRLARSIKFLFIGNQSDFSSYGIVLVLKQFVFIVSVRNVMVTKHQNSYFHGWLDQ